MTISVDLGPRLESFVEELVAAGTYASRDALVRDAIRLIEEREVRFATLDAALAEGLADIEAGRSHTLDQVRERLHTKFGELGGPSRP